MKKQKKRRNKKLSFQTTNLSNEQLRKRWIFATVGLIFLFLILILVIILYFTGKVQIPGFPTFANVIPENDPQSGSRINQEYIRKHVEEYDDYDYEEFYQKQISKPKKGEEIALIYISGTDKPVKAKLFAEEVPEIVKRFKELVNRGYYNNQEFFVDANRVCSTSIVDSRIDWGELSVADNVFKVPESLANVIDSWDSMEVKTNKVLPYNGALCADALILDNKLLSADFFIMNIDSKYVTDRKTLNLPQQLKDLFKKHGGDPTYKSIYMKEITEYNLPLYGNLLDYLKHPTFGHVFEGMELINNIIKTNKVYKINKIQIVKYNE